MTEQKRALPKPGSIESYPVLPLRDIVVFPHMIVPLFVGRDKSIRALEEVMRSDRYILLATQKNASEDDPAADAIYKTGTLATVLQLLKLPDNTVKVLVEGVSRAEVRKYTRTDEYYEADAEAVADGAEDQVEVEALGRSVVSEFENYVKLNKKVSPEVVAAVTQIEDYSKLADTVASHLAVKIADKQAVLEMPLVSKRLEKCLQLMESEISVLQVEKRIRTRVKRQMEKTQREYYLNEQMKAIQRELGDGEEGGNEVTELEERIKKTKLSKEAKDKGFVDELGYESEALDDAKSKAGAERVVTAFGTGQKSGEGPDIGEIVRIIAGTEEHAGGRPHIAVLAEEGSRREEPALGGRGQPDLTRRRRVGQRHASRP